MITDINANKIKELFEMAKELKFKLDLSKDREYLLEEQIASKDDELEKQGLAQDEAIKQKDQVIHDRDQVIKDLEERLNISETGYESLVESLKDDL